MIRKDELTFLNTSSRWQHQAYFWKHVMSRVMKREPFFMSLQDTLSMMIRSGKPWAVVFIIFFFLNFFFFLSFKTKMYLGNYPDIFRRRTYNFPLTHFPKEVQLKKQIITTEVHFIEIALSFGDWLSTMCLCLSTWLWKEAWEMIVIILFYRGRNTGSEGRISPYSYRWLFTDYKSWCLSQYSEQNKWMLLLLLSHFSHVRLCVTP